MPSFRFDTEAGSAVKDFAFCTKLSSFCDILLKNVSSFFLLG